MEMLRAWYQRAATAYMQQTSHTSHPCRVSRYQTPAAAVTPESHRFCEKRVNEKAVNGYQEFPFFGGKKIYVTYCLCDLF